MPTLEELYEVDETGKKIAYEYMNRSDRLAYGHAYRWTYNVERFVNDLTNSILPALFERDERIDKERLDDTLYGLKDTFSTAIFYVKEALDTCEKMGVPFSECDGNLRYYVKEVNEEYRNFSELIKGRSENCAWGIDAPEYNVSFAINDLTSCYHGLVEVFAEHNLNLIDYKSYASEDATDRAIELCEIWDDETEHGADAGLLTYTDHSAIACIATDDKSQLKVGDSPGHRTEVNFKEDKVVYYDNDDDVNVSMYKLLTDNGLKCRIDWGQKIECNGVNELDKNRRDKLARIIGYSTSMDIRIAKRMKNIVEATDKPYKKIEDNDYYTNFMFDMKPELNIQECFEDENIVEKEFGDLKDALKHACEIAVKPLDVEHAPEEVLERIEKERRACEKAIAIETCAVRKIIEG